MAHAEAAFHDNLAKQSAVSSAHPSGAPVSAELWSVMLEGRDIQLELELRIKTFFVFARELLDEVVRTIDHFARSGTEIGSHTRLDTHLPRKAVELGFDEP